MPVKVEQHPPKAGKLENSAVKDLSGVRQGVFLPASVRIGTEILQSGFLFGSFFVPFSGVIRMGI